MRLAEKTAIEVLILGTGCLLEECLAMLMKREPEFHVVTRTGPNPVALLTDLDNVPLDVILLCDPNQRDWTRTSEILNQLPVQEHLRLIVVRSDDNTVDVYDKRGLELTGKADLHSLIRNHLKVF